MTTATPDFAAIKSRQQAMWATGDYASIAPLIVPIAELLPDAADLQAGWRILDVATGSGNAAIAAARRNTIVTGLDYVPALLERARRRASAEGVHVEWVEGDAENLPFEDQSFDAVLSIFGSMFAPDHGRTAREMIRVCRPGGRIAMCNWTPDGFTGEMFKIAARFNPPPPGIASPVRWGDAAYIRELFACSILSSDVLTFTFRFASPEAFLARFRAQFGPTIKAFQAAGPENEQALAADFIDLIRRFDRNMSEGGPIAISATYLQIILQRD